MEAKGGEGDFTPRETEKMRSALVAISLERRAAMRKVIDALIEMLPPAGSVWPIDERKRWLDVMSAALILGYGCKAEVKTTIEDDGESIRVDLQDADQN